MNVAKYINHIITELQTRGIKHDNSKLNSPEVEIFTEYTPKLAKSTYGSDEYKGFLKEMQVGLDHHYANNRHHPEYFKNGINDMNLIDITEMLCDWKAATLRHNNGDLFTSIELNQKRFKYDDQLKSILINTAKELYTYVVEVKRDRQTVIFFAADTIDALYNKINTSKDVEPNTKGLLKYGNNNIFKEKGYFTTLHIDDNFDYYWTVNAY
jgi:hypothetical protein